MTPGDLAAASLRASPILITILVACAVRHRSSPSLRHAALMLGMASLAMMPWIAQLPASWTIPSAGPFSARLPADFLAPPGPAGLPAVLDAGWLAPVALAWAVGTAVLLLRVALGLAGLARLRRRVLHAGPARPVRFGVSRSRVAFCVSPEVDRPMAIGFARPLVLLPPEARRWTAAQRRAVLRHELAHVRRGDAWWLLITCLVRALHWPNPLVWLAARRARAATEEACDEAVLLAGRESERASQRPHARDRERSLDPLDYAQLLVRLARRAARERSRHDALIPTMTGGTGLPARLEKLLAGPPPARPSRRTRSMRRAALFATTVFAAGLLGTANAATPPLDPSAGPAAGGDLEVEDVEIDVDVVTIRPAATERAATTTP